MKKIIGFMLLLVLLQSSALAQRDRMLNISAQGIINDRIPSIACTIIIGEVPIAVFAEAETSGTNPSLVLAVIDNGQLIPVDSNNDWVNLPSSEQQIISTAIRPLRRTTDSATVGTVTNLAICALSIESIQGGPTGVVNLQLTDISDALSSSSPRLKQYSRATAAEKSFGHDFDPELEARITQMLQDYALENGLNW